MHCECEHESHFHGDACATPPDLCRCNEGHAYNAALAVRDVKTDFGTFMMCTECIEKCHMIHARKF